MGKPPPKALAEPTLQCPEAAEYLWNYFIEVSAGLAANGMAPTRLTWEALKAWCDLRDIELEPWEALALVNLGLIRADVLAEDVATQS